MDDDREHYHRRWFGFPYGHLIWPLLIGILLILWGLSDLLGIDLWHYIWPAIAIVLGILVILGGIFGRRRRY
jgi:Na+/citrate or Na+/malate symporter